MIQDIYPSKMDITYKNRNIHAGDHLLLFDKDGRAFIKICDGEIEYLSSEDFTEDQSVYLFSIDQRNYFLNLNFENVNAWVENNKEKGFNFYSIREIRDKSAGVEVLALFTAYHLWKWYSDNRFCGKCGAKITFSDKERALICPECGNVIYPRINPAVIIGVINGDSILITRYKVGYKHNALVAGFTEIGESLEETVRREVMEETGLKVKNIRYYKSQPWGMAQDLLAGFYCEVDGDTTIKMDENELKYAEWVKREDVVLQPNSLSLTNEMMKKFKDSPSG
ncbi:MAG: NAD(+) diphosphatase [Eubacterium sp.]|nr:NAD(+) diphosphatase [Eubacterium sp.]